MRSVDPLFAPASPVIVDAKHLGTIIIVGGLGIALIGVAVRFGLLSWFGRLPGDIRYEGESTRVYIPLTSMLLVSAGLSLLVWMWRRVSG